MPVDATGTALLMGDYVDLTGTEWYTTYTAHDGAIFEPIQVCRFGRVTSYNDDRDVIIVRHWRQNFATRRWMEVVTEHPSRELLFHRLGYRVQDEDDEPNDNVRDDDTSFIVADDLEAEQSGSSTNTTEVLQAWVNYINTLRLPNQDNDA